VVISEKLLEGEKFISFLEGDQSCIINLFVSEEGVHFETAQRTDDRLFKHVKPLFDVGVLREVYSLEVVGFRAEDQRNPYHLVDILPLELLLLGLLLGDIVRSHLVQLLKVRVHVHGIVEVSLLLWSKIVVLILLSLKVRVSIVELFIEIFRDHHIEIIVLGLGKHQLELFPHKGLLVLIPLQIPILNVPVLNMEVLWLLLLLILVLVLIQLLVLVVIRLVEHDHAEILVSLSDLGVIQRSIGLFIVLFRELSHYLTEFQYLNLL